MLILARKPRQVIIVHDRDTGEKLCRIVLQRVGGGIDCAVRLGFDAPDHVLIDREELLSVSATSVTRLPGGATTASARPGAPGGKSPGVSGPRGPDRRRR